MAAAPAPEIFTRDDALRRCYADPPGSDGKRHNGTIDLRQADLRNADLSGCDLRDTWIEASQLGGADVTGAKLPEEIAQFKGLDALSSIVPAVATQFIALLGACLYCGLAIFTTTDKALILDSSTQPLPIVQTPIQVVGFYWLAPAILVILSLYLQLNLQRMWETLAGLPAKFPDGRRLDEHAYPWVYIQRVRTHLPRLKAESKFVSRVENLLGSVLGYWAVPATLVFSYFWAAAVRHSPALAAWHVLLFTAALLVSLQFQRSSCEALHGVPPAKGFEALRSKESLQRSGVSLLLGLLFAAVIWGTWDQSTARLRNAELSTKPTGWVASQQDTSQVKGASLAKANLAGADMQNAFLVNADLGGSDLRRANLSGADLRGAKLDHANLSGAQLGNANLQDATLHGAMFGESAEPVRKASNWVLAHYGRPGLQLLNLPLDHDDRLKSFDFHGYELRPSSDDGILNFQHASLKGANFTGVNLTGADFSSADLTDAILAKCPLDQARFFSANLLRSNLGGAQLTKATGLTRAQLKEAVICGDTKLPGWLKSLESQEPCPE